MLAAAAAAERAHGIHAGAVGVRWGRPELAVAPENLGQRPPRPAFIRPCHEALATGALEGFRARGADDLRGVAQQVLAAAVVEQIVVAAHE